MKSTYSLKHSRATSRMPLAIERDDALWQWAYERKKRILQELEPLPKNPFWSRLIKPFSRFNP